MGEGPPGWDQGCQTQNIVTMTMGLMGVSPMIHLTYRTKTTRVLVGNTGGSTAHFIEGLEANQRNLCQGENMVICFTRPIQYGGDHLHLALSLT